MVSLFLFGSSCNSSATTMCPTEPVDGIDVADLHIRVRPATQNLSRSFRTRFGVAVELQKPKDEDNPKPKIAPRN